MGGVVNECIPYYEPGSRITGKASATVNGKRFLKISGNRTADIEVVSDDVDGGNVQVAHADAGGVVFGVAEYDAASGKPVGVIAGPGYVLPVVADGAISAGQQVMVGANGKAKALADVAAVAASIATGVVGSNNAIRWTARDSGFAGNGISVAIVNPGVGNVTIDVAVNGNDIVVNPVTDGGGVITSTAADIIAAIQANADANALVSVANEGASSGAGIVAAVAATNLSGGADTGPGRPVGLSIATVADAADAQVKLY